jgi:anti-sigma-K factor RskA
MGLRFAMRTFARAEQTDIELLLPWYAAGTLDRRAAAQVEAALAHDVDLGRQYEFVRRELAETIHLNENLGAPTARAGERLAAALVAEAATAASRNSTVGHGRRLGNWLSELSPRTLKWAATIAALALLLQAGLIADLSGVHYFSGATVEDSKSAEAIYAYVSFAPKASSSDITKFLHAHRAQVVEGPRANGIYKIRVAGASSEADMAEIVQDIRQPNDLVRFIGMTIK